MSDELDKFLKSIGETPSAERPRAPAAEPPAPAAAPASAVTGAGGLTGALESIHDFTTSVDTGILRAGAGAVTGMPRAANAALGYFKPEWAQTLGDLAEQVPGVKRTEEFAEEPSKNWGETIGYGGGLLGSMAVGGGWSGAEQLAARTFPPAMRFIGGRMVPQATKLSSRAGAVGRGADVLAQGAAAGATADPKSPGTGALVGAGASAALPLVGKFLRSEEGQRLATILGGTGLVHLIAPWLEKMGVSYPFSWIIPASMLGGHYMSPTRAGTFTREALRKGFEGTGKMLEGEAPKIGRKIGPKGLPGRKRANPNLGPLISSPPVTGAEAGAGAGWLKDAAGQVYPSRPAASEPAEEELDRR